MSMYTHDLCVGVDQWSAGVTAVRTARVEDQIAMIFVATNGLLDTVPVNKVREFEKDFVSVMNATQKPVMDALKAGKYDDSLTDVLRKVSKEVASKY